MMRLQLDDVLLASTRTASRGFLFGLCLICGSVSSSHSLHGAEIAVSTAKSSPPQINAEADPLCVNSGTLVICGGGILPSKILDRFLELGGGPRARVVIVTSASYVADLDMPLRLSGWYDRLAENEMATLEILHTRSREQAEDPEFSRVLDDATAVWFVGGTQNWLSQTYVHTKTEERLHAVLARGGVIGGTSAGAAVMSRQMIAEGRDEPTLSTGLGLLPGTIVDQHFRKRNRLNRLVRAMQLRPGTVGFGIDEGTALIVRGRSLEVLGDSDVSVCLSESPVRPQRVESIPAGEKGDLVMLRRAAIARAEPHMIRKPVETPEVQQGTLVIVGGGSTPKEAIDRFLFAAGGNEASIVVVSNALSENPPPQNEVCGWLSSAGAKNVYQFHAKRGEDLKSSELLAKLTAARGVWFTGGRQWRLVDAYLDTHVQELFHDVLRRGGVIGGTSAGATIQGDYLVRGNPLGNTEMMAEGYERGFGFLPGVAIDQHFTQRDRLKDLVQLKKQHPELIGIGIDESTALIVQGSTMQVVGQHQVTVFDHDAAHKAANEDYAILKSGESYDFRQRRRVNIEVAEAETRDEAKPESVGDAR